MDLPETPHADSIEEVRSLLLTGPSGLSDNEAKVRRATFGNNSLTEERTSWFVIFLRQFRSILVSILIIAPVISLIVSDIKDFFIIIFIIGVNSITGFCCRSTGRS